MNRTTLLVLLLLSPLAFAKPVSISKVNGAIRAEAGTEYAELSTVNGGIRIAEGALVQKADTVNGGISIDGNAHVGEAGTVNGGIEIGPGATIERDATTVNGVVRLERAAQVHGRVETVNGTIRLTAARVDGGIETVNGSIKLEDGSHVRGGITVQKPKGNWFSFGKRNKPRVEIGPQSVVEGELRFDQEVELVVHPSAKIGPVVGEAAGSIQIER